MKNFTLAIVALALVLTTSAALAQDNMKGHMMNGHMMKVQTHMSGNSMMLKNMMMDLSQDEKRTATNHMNRMTTREKTLMMKRRSM